MPPLPCAFSDIRSRKQLADKLNVDIQSLDLVTLTDTTCKSDDVIYPLLKIIMVIVFYAVNAGILGNLMRMDR
jgi:hypothetical protein